MSLEGWRSRKIRDGGVNQPYRLGEMSYHPHLNPTPIKFGSLHLIFHLLTPTRFDRSTSYLSHPSVPRLFRDPLDTTGVLPIFSSAFTPPTLSSRYPVFPISHSLYIRNPRLAPLDYFDLPAQSLHSLLSITSIRSFQFTSTRSSRATFTRSARVGR